MSARRFALFAALALFIAFVAVNVTANSWFKSWRLDLTENHLYSLSPGTQETLNQLTEPVQLTLYYSRDSAARLPQVQAYASRVREMLQTFQARSRGRVRFVEVNVEAFSDQEDDAVAAGIEPYRPFEGADPIYLGLTGANAIDDQRTIPFFDPQREAFLEYEVTRLIYELENPDPVHVGLITSLPIDPATAVDPRTGAGMGQSVFAVEMGRLMQVTRLAPGFSVIPDDIDVLAVIHPGELTPTQAFAIDQFVLRKGRAFIALDPASLMAEQARGGFDAFSPTDGAPLASTLEPLLSAWGVTLSPGVVLDGQHALSVNTQDPRTGQTIEAPQPLFFTAVPQNDGLDRDDLMTAWLQRGVNFGLAGSLAVTEREGVESHPLARTSGQTMRMSAAEALQRPSPFQIMSMWPQGSGRRETVAVRLSGTLPTAFPEGRPAAEAPPPPVEGEAPAPDAAPTDAETAPVDDAPVLARSETSAQIVIVADVDFLADDFYIDPRTGTPGADNAAFALNAIDVLGGSDALVSLRSRAPSLRRMDLVEEMENDARRRIERRQTELQQELQETEAQLAELQARGRGSGFFSGDLGAELTPEEAATIEQFRARAIQVRGELRGAERELRGDIDRLQGAIVFINIWLAPLLIAAGGVFLFWRRQRRGRARQ
ncbi:MAG: Gldg family protein [Hyphomonadaceae bacterium]